MSSGSSCVGTYFLPLLKQLSWDKGVPSGGTHNNISELSTSMSFSSVQSRLSWPCYRLFCHEIRSLICCPDSMFKHYPTVAGSTVFYLYMHFPHYIMTHLSPTMQPQMLQFPSLQNVLVGSAILLMFDLIPKQCNCMWTWEINPLSNTYAMVLHKFTDICRFTRYIHFRNLW